MPREGAVVGLGDGEAATRARERHNGGYYASWTLLSAPPRKIRA